MLYNNILMIIIERWLGKFTDSICNNLVQLIVCCCVAKEYNHNIIKFPMHDDNHTIFKSDEIILNNKGKDRKKIISGTYANFDEITNKNIKIKDRSIRTCVDVARKYIYPILKLDKKLDGDFNDVLFIHIRSGDIFSTFIHKNYVQPPVSFYKLIINSKQWKNIILISEDDVNPCINELKSQYDVKHYQTKNITETISIITHAINLVIGFGTFGYMMAYLSLNLKHLYLPLYCNRFFPDNDVQFDLHFVDIKNYINIGDWTASIEQCDLMINHNINDVSFL